jgi:hypothetical protein
MYHQKFKRSNMYQMMKSIFVAVLLCSVTSQVTAQVGIGTTGSVDASARLQVDANASTNAKGFLPPRVELTSTSSISPFNVTPATGLFVYNIATAGNVSPGFYFFNGTQWVRIIDQQPDATVSFNQNTPTTGGVVFTPDVQNSTNHIYVSSTNNSQWFYNGSSYVTYTAPAATAWYATGGTTDAGDNKSSSIYRAGKIGIGGNTAPNATLDVRTNPTSASDPGAGYIGVGTTDAAASTAAAGAIRYSTLDGGRLQYSNGAAWNTLESNVEKANVYATRLSSSVFNVNNSTIDNVFGSFSSSSGAGTTQLNNTSGVYTAPRNGLYTVSAGMSFRMLSASTSGTFHFLVMKGGINGTEVCNQAIPINYPIGSVLSANISCSVPLSQGETVSIKYHNFTGSTIEVSLSSVYQGRYYFTVTEN